MLTPEQIRAGQLWPAFCDRLKAAAEVVTASNAPDTAFDRAEGARYLSRLIRLGLEIYVEHGDVDFPGFYMPSHETAKMGGDNPDNLYLSATISGDRSYRLWGNIGTVTYLSVGSKANRYAVDGTMASTGELDKSDFRPNADGDFEIIASAQDPGSGVAWLPLAPDSTMLHLRQTFLNRRAERPASIRIERISPGPAAPGPVDPEQLAERMMRAADFVVNTAKLFSGWISLFMSRPNEIIDWGQEMFLKAGGDPQIFYIHGYWRLEPNQAWVIRTEIPECEHWNFQINNWWMESLDYRYHPVWVNKANAKYDDDGRVTIVVSERDPGFGNWIPTLGHTQGSGMFRWVKASTHPLPSYEVITL